MRVEVGRCPVGEVAELYRALAVTCVEKEIARILVVVTDDDLDAERALRDAATTMVLAGIPAGLRLAIVAASPSVVQTYRTTGKDLSAAGIATRLFESEEAAARWLEGPSEGARQAA